ncbi:MAG: formyltetrahydrofolate deformylase [Sphingopyxis terrae]|nr:MAG: formyltetrahydrofolate deformylase [Sphingopyxis terrae]
MTEKFILTVSCPNQRGIVSKISTAIFRANGDILEADQYDDTTTASFFMRVVFDLERASEAALQSDLGKLAKDLGMQWELRRGSARQRVLLLVSKFDHCLVDLLYRWRIGELKMDIAGIVSNHPREVFGPADFGAIPFHHLPVTKETKADQERQIRELVEVEQVDLVVLARYMQILSDEMAAYLSGRCINIHHSFLPGFKGAKPYHQAHSRGVKLIGATAHYVTADLDEGPIVEQDVERVSHSDSPEDLVRKGRDIERRVLARALSFHLEGRALLNGSTTVVFRD